MDKAQLTIIFKKYGTSVIKELTKQLLMAGKRASGKLIKSLRVDVKPLAQEIQVQISGEKYLEYVDKGRKKGKFPNVKAIEKWTTLRGIPKSAAWPIAYSIYKNGIKPTNVIAKTIQNMSKATQQIEKDYALFLETEILKNIKTQNK